MANEASTNVKQEVGLDFQESSLLADHCAYARQSDPCRSIACQEDSVPVNSFTVMSPLFRMNE